MPANSYTGQYDGGIFSIKASNLVSPDWGLQPFRLQTSWPAPLLWLCHHSTHSFSSRFVSTPFHTFYHCWWDSYDSGNSSILMSSLLSRLNLQQWPLQTSLQRLWPCHMVPSLCFCTWSLQSHSFILQNQYHLGDTYTLPIFIFQRELKLWSPLTNSCCFLTLKYYSKDFT